MTDDEISVFTNNDGAAVINGLNLLLALSMHQKAKVALFDIMSESAKVNDVSFDSLFEDLTAARTHIIEMNKMLQQHGIMPGH